MNLMQSDPSCLDLPLRVVLLLAADEAALVTGALAPGAAVTTCTDLGELVRALAGEPAAVILAREALDGASPAPLVLLTERAAAVLVVTEPPADWPPAEWAGTLSGAVALPRPLCAPLVRQTLTLALVAARAGEADRALRESEARWRLFVDHSPAVAWVKDVEGRYVHLSRSFERRFDARRSDWRGRETAELWPAAQAARFAERDRLVIATGEPLQSIEETGNPDGTPAYWLTSRFPFRDGEGRLFVGGVAVDITSQRQAEAALREGEARFRSTFENAAVGMTNVGLDGRFLRVNQRFAEITGRSAEELLQLRLQDVAHPDDVDLCVDVARRVIAGGVVTEAFDKRYLRPDGQVIWAHVTCSLQRDAEGQPSYLIGVIEDITARKTAEAELQATAARLRAVFETMPESLMLVDADGDVVYTNPAHARRSGWPETATLPAAEYLSRLELSDATGRVLPLEEWPLSRALRGETVRDYELGVRRVDLGERYVTLCTAAPILDGAGRVSLALLTLRDITPRKRAEEALRTSEAHSRAILEALPDAVCRLRADGTLTYLHAPSWPGVPELSGDVSNLADLVTEPVLGQARRHLAECLATGQPQHFEYSFEADGAILSHEVRLVACGAEEALAVVRDVTETKRLQEQLRQAAKMEAVGQLAGGIAHDFNNLLTIQIGHTEFAADVLEPNHPAAVELAEIRRAADRAAELTRQLLAFSRKQPITPQHVDASEIVENLGRMLSRTIGEDIALFTHPAPGLWPTLVDPVQLEQAILNLALNAKDAMPRGGRLTITTENRTLRAADLEPTWGLTPGEYMVLTVADTGTGMDEAVRQRVFEPFFTTKAVGQGTGLGLATVYGIAKQNGGHVTCDSAPECGARFTLYLPRAGAAAAPVTPPPPAGEPHGTVLLVEDEGPLRAITERVLRGAGYAVEVASSGEEALALAEQVGQPLRLLLTDVVLPGMPGTELAHRLQAEQPGLRVLYTSGFAELTMSRRGVLKPGMVMLHKPFTTSALLAKVRDVLDPPNPDLISR